MSFKLARWALFAVSLALSGCSRPPEAEAPRSESPEAQQAIVDRAAASVNGMSEQFAALSSYLREARAVLVFPRLIKASLIFGGQGGTGVLVTRAADGSWSAPAFYSVGAPSVGAQIGYQEATVILVLMNDATVKRAIDSSLTLGTDATVALGQPGERGEAEREVLPKDVYAFAEASGAFAGVALEGYVVAPREKHNVAYYGAGATPHAIVLERRFDHPGALVLRQALSEAAAEPASTQKDNAPAPGSAAPLEPQSSPGWSPESSDEGDHGYRACSLESRQTQACIQIYDPVCADVDTGVRCIKAPCPEARTQKTFGNACEACSDAKTLGFRPGKCP